ncbi:MAG: glycosyltransferase family 4 protein [Micropepsaceae bacterium]
MSEILTFVVPGSLATRTGGYAYDRKIIENLRESGWTVEPVELGSGFPNPDQKTLANTEKSFSAIPDGALVIVDGLAFGVLPEIAAREHLRLKLVALVHHPLADETGLGDEQRAELRRSEVHALGFAHHVVVTSNFTRRRLVEYGVEEKKISVVEPGIDPAPLGKGRDRSGPGAPMQMLCPASYIPRKGHVDLLRALSELKELPWQLICAGNTKLDTGLYAEICALREAAGLNQRVELRDEVNEGELDRLYSAADLIVLASHYEGFGMVVTEAVARGLPVITTTGGALAETLPSGAGLASPPGDINALKENLHRVLTDEAAYARLFEAARKAREALPTWDEASRAFAQALKP